MERSKEILLSKGGVPQFNVDAYENILTATEDHYRRFLLAKDVSVSFVGEPPLQQVEVWHDKKLDFLDWTNFPRYGSQ